MSSVCNVFTPVDAVTTVLANTASASCAIKPVCVPVLVTTADLTTSLSSGLSLTISSSVLYSKFLTCNFSIISKPLS